MNDRNVDGLRSQRKDLVSVGRRGKGRILPSISDATTATSIIVATVEHFRKKKKKNIYVFPLKFGHQDLGKNAEAAHDASVLDSSEASSAVPDSSLRYILPGKL